MTLVPIILFCYNRPWHVEQTLIALSENELADQSVLYIYCDGPKANATEEQIEKIKEVRKVVRKIRIMLFNIISNKSFVLPVR